MASTPKWATGRVVRCTVELPVELHAAAVVAGKLRRRALKAWIVDVIEEKIESLQEVDINSKGFVPPGLRKG